MAERWVMWIDTKPTDATPRELLVYDEDEWRDEFGRPPRWALDERQISREAASELSIRWHRAKNARVLPVWHPENGALLGWQYKNAEGTWCHDGTPKSHSLFGIDVFEPGTTAILVESPLDVAVLLSAGLDGGLASFGAGVSRAQLQLLADRAKRVFVALDNDDAGRMGTEKISVSSELAGKPLFVLNYEAAPKAKDVGEMSDDEIREGLRTAKRIHR
jgi:5S rRNA maturation endonuclease (ribonuclease M5)